MEHWNNMFYRRAAQLAAIVTAGLLTASVQAQPNSPVGAWDVAASGSGQQALMVLEFSPDNTLSGYALFAGTKKKSEASNGDRGGSDSRGGGGKEESKTNNVIVTIVSGFTSVAGAWALDPQGNVIGFFTYVLEDGTTAGKTNSVSFKGKAKANRRLTMIAKTPGQQIAFRGLPLRTVVPKGGWSYDGSGWQGIKKVGGGIQQEFLELGVYPELPVPNIYAVNGFGPDYVYTYSNGNFCVISRHGKIGFSIDEQKGDAFSLRASIGSLNNRAKAKANTKGYANLKNFEFKASRTY